MALEVADGLPGVVVGVLPALPLDQVLRLAWVQVSGVRCQVSGIH